MQAGREIKFQVWDQDAKKMWTWEDINKADQEGILCFLDMLEEDQFIPRQFTGLRDKNGKEIYEGDIIRAKNGVQIGTVIWVESDCKYVVRWTKDNPTKMVYDSNMSSAQWGEVIGNIYENPELLQAG
jgi:uncharacterized phage protein (TIGR01671 family)